MTKEKERAEEEKMSKHFENDKTFGMIMYLKNYTSDYDSLRECAIGYMIEYSGCDREVYTNEKIENIIYEVFCDFINCVDRPSSQFYQMRESKKILELTGMTFNIYDLMLSAMSMVQVRDDNGYINGFTEEMFKENK